MSETDPNSKNNIDIDLSVNVETTPNPKLPAISDPATGKKIPAKPSADMPPMPSFKDFVRSKTKDIV